MSKKTPKFDNIRVNKKKFHKSEQPIDLMSVNVDQIVISDTFKHSDESLWEKYEKLWDVIKNKLSIKFHSKPIYNQKYLKAKVREFDGVIKTNFLGNDTPKENMHYTCIDCKTIGCIMRMDNKNHPQIYLAECKYRIRKIQMYRFINTQLKSDSNSDSDSEAESKSDAELMAKLKPDSDSE